MQSGYYLLSPSRCSWIAGDKVSTTGETLSRTGDKSGITGNKGGIVGDALSPAGESLLTSCDNAGITSDALSLPVNKVSRSGDGMPHRDSKARMQARKDGCMVSGTEAPRIPFNPTGR
jgi:hypothetical protein